MSHELRQKVLEKALRGWIPEAGDTCRGAEGAMAVADHEEAAAGELVVNEQAEAEGEGRGLGTFSRGVVAHSA